ncbi:MAG: NTP transferase domain-containing protein [Bacteroidota bacterium]
MSDQLSSLYGLVLAGGQSRRMGIDKGQINYHGVPQREYIGGLLQQVGCAKVYWSLAETPEQSTPFPVLIDTFADVGPIAGLYAAFAHHPNVAWLVVACDFPLLGMETLHFLLHHRRSDLDATAFKNEHHDFPEPLLTIYEPSTQLLLEKSKQQQQYSLKRLLLEARTQLLVPPSFQSLLNVNTPDLAKKIRDELQ